MVERRGTPPDTTDRTGSAVDPDDARPITPRLTWQRTLLLLALLAGSFWFALRNLDWNAVLEAIGTADPLWVLGVALIVLAAHLARAIRWRLFIPDGDKVPLSAAFDATIIGYFANNLIPRSGELLRPWILARQQQAPTSRYLATIVVERALDGLTLLAILGMILLFAGDELARLLAGIDGFEGISGGDLLVRLGLPMLVLLGLLAVIIFTPFGERILARVTGMLPERFAEKIMAGYREFRHGARLPDPVRRTPGILFWTGVIWTGYALSLYCGVVAFGFPADFGLDFGDAVVILGITTIGVAIAPTPGGFGIFHSFARATLAILYGVPVEIAVAFALVVHAAQYLVTMVVGGIVLVRRGRDLIPTRMQPEDPPTG